MFLLIILKDSIIIKLTNQISSYDKQLDNAENKIEKLEKENNELRNQLK